MKFVKKSSNFESIQFLKKLLNFWIDFWVVILVVVINLLFFRYLFVKIDLRKTKLFLGQNLEQIEIDFISEFSIEFHSNRLHFDQLVPKWIFLILKEFDFNCKNSKISQNYIIIFNSIKDQSSITKVCILKDFIYNEKRELIVI